LFINESLPNFVKSCTCIGSTILLKQNFLANGFLMDRFAILAIFAGFFTLGPFLAMKTTFSGTFVKTIYVDNGEGFLEHILDVLYLHWFLRY